MTGTALVLWLAAVVVAAGLGVVVGRRLAGRSAPRPSPRAALPTLARRAALSEQVVDVSATGVVVVDRDEFVVLVNPAARRLGVVERDRVVLPELVDVVRTLFTCEEPRPLTLTVDPPAARRTDPTALSVTAAPVRLPGELRPGAVALLVDDVTEARRLEDVRRDFVANVSHELKTPVGALTLLAEAVQEAADDPEAVARFAGRMQHEGNRLGRLVRELIDLSRLQGAEPLPGDDLVPVAGVVEDAVDAHRLSAERAGITVLVRCPDDVAVTGNAAQLAMAVSNLLENALAYSPAGTRVAVVVSTGNDAAGTDGSGVGVVRIAVSDQGIGISPADQERVFERFYRVDQARSRATGGTGLGLAIVKHIASNHGGSVSVWSREGSGSTFTLVLPAAVTSQTDPTGRDLLLSDVPGPDADRAGPSRPDRGRPDVLPTPVPAAVPHGHPDERSSVPTDSDVDTDTDTDTDTDRTLTTHRGEVRT